MRAKVEPDLLECLPHGGVLERRVVNVEPTPGEPDLPAPGVPFARRAEDDEEFRVVPGQGMQHERDRRFLERLVALGELRRRARERGGEARHERMTLPAGAAHFSPRPAHPMRPTPPIHP